MTVATGGLTTYATEGGVLYRIHTLTSSDTLNITEAGEVEYLVVGGGGGGGSDMGGGGGAGGYLAGTLSAVIGSYPITIGAGGSGAIAGTSRNAGSNGQNTTAFSLTAIGGGGGASTHGGGAYAGGSGGSGGGASGRNANRGLGTAGQGNNGGNSGGAWYPGGGGGAGSEGSSNPANGGGGVQNAILGTSYFWAAGGGGAGYTTIGGNAGQGGGGGGAPRVNGNGGSGDTNGLNPGENGGDGATGGQPNVPGGNAGANTGSGGGGGSHYNSNNYGGNGGSGIVVVRYAMKLYVLDSSSQAVSSLNEGDTYTFRYDNVNTPNGTYAYYIEGVSSADINGASLTGNVTVTDGIGNVSITTTADISGSEGIELLKFSINGTYDSVNAFAVLEIPILDTSKIITVSPDLSSVPLGTPITFTINTTGESNGTLVPYTISNVTSAQIDGTPLTGNFTINNNQGSLTVSTSGVVNSNVIITSYGDVATMFVSFIGGFDDDIVLNQYNNSIFTIQDIPVQMNIDHFGGPDYILDAGLLIKDIPVQMNIDHFGGPDYTLDAGLLIKDVANIDFNNSAEKISRRLMTELDGQINTYVIPAMGEIKREYWF